MQFFREKMPQLGTEIEKKTKKSDNYVIFVKFSIHLLAYKVKTVPVGKKLLSNRTV